MGILPYLLLFLPTVVTVLSFSLGGPWLLLPPLVLFGAVPLVDHLVGLDRRNGVPAPRWALRLLPSSFVAVQVAVLVLGIPVVLRESWGTWERLGGVVALGFHTSSAILVAHELMHRPGRVERLLADVLMLSACYPHFSIEHVQGHHRNVGTPGDPASSRFGESLYAFLPRTLYGGFQSAWRIEAARLASIGRPMWCRDNRMLAYAAVTLVVLGAAAAAGSGVLTVFLGQAAIAVLMLETINYIEHYGLSRREVGAGKWERVRPEHSWNSSHRVSNWILVNLARHSDHHAHPARPYPELRHYENVPQFPTGYAGMFLLALIPPLWFRVMNPRVKRLQAAGG